MEKYRICPACKNMSTTTHWDMVTKEKIGAKDNDPFLSCDSDLDKLAEDEAYFICPMCGKEIQGTDMKDPSSK